MIDASSYVIGVDIGTTSTKAVVFNGDGKVEGHYTAGYPLLTPSPGVAEQDPQEIYAAVLKAIRAAIRASGRAATRIRCVGFSAAMHSLIAVDSEGRPMTASITWADTRSAAWAEKIARDMHGHDVYLRTGTPIHPMSPLAKLVWLRHERPDLFERADRFVGIKEYVFFRLFGQWIVDYSMASATGLFNLRKLDWDEGALALAGLTPARLPLLVPPTHHLEGLDPALAADLGLAADVPFVVGANDGVLSNLGVNAIQAGEVAITIGTSGAMRAVLDRPLTDAKGRTFCYLLTEKHWVVGGPINNGGIAFRWVRDELAAAETETAKRLGIDPYDVLTRIAERVPPGSEGLIFHPFLTGERAPWWNASMRASFFGLAAHHRKEHMIRSVLEGVIYSLFSILPAVEALIGPTRTMKATGGFARSGLWRQMLADVFDREVVVPESFESSCLGAAILALYALGEADTLNVVARMVGATHRHQPIPQNVAVYAQLSSIYMSVPTKLGEEYARLAAFQKGHPADKDISENGRRAGKRGARGEFASRRSSMSIHPTLTAVTDRIRERSRESRAAYLERLEQARSKGPVRGHMSCTNLAHAFAAFGPHDKCVLREGRLPNIGIVSAYNDMLSAHQPLERFPAIIKQAAREAGGVAQFAGGVPAMCDGVTQGQPGMELSLFSRDVIALATAVSLSHNTFDAVLCIGICDKIVPGLLIGALSFGHLPTIMVPGGPMPSGLPNQDKAKVRQLYAQGKVGRDALLEAESQAYHAPGTCTFYGTANSNQMLMEVMGLHMPGTAFVNPNTPLRDALTDAAARRVLQITALGEDYTPVGRVIDERAIANGIVGLLATGGSTNHTIHLVAIAHAAGISINWGDFSELSAVVPLLAKIYPNGAGDVNDFQRAGGMGFLIAQLLDAGLLHDDVLTIAGQGLKAYRNEPFLDDGRLGWRPAPEESRDESILRPTSRPFSPDGGLKLLRGNLGRAVIKTSAVKPDRHRVEAPAIVFNDQEELMAAFDRGELRRDFIAVVRYQGPRANGMPELHKLTPPLGVLQDEGFKVALVTDGRMSGASGKVPAAIHVTPECLADGPLAKVRTGDLLRLDATQGILEARVADDVLASRPVDAIDLTPSHFGLGRELFAMFRANAASAERGAITWLPPEERDRAAETQEQARARSTDAKSARVQDHFVYSPEAMGEAQQ